jgi:hypothetical protein
MQWGICSLKKSAGASDYPLLILSHGIEEHLLAIIIVIVIIVQLIC